MDHLSEPWLAALDAALEARDRLRPLASQCALGVTQVVTAGDGAPLVYHFSSHGGAARVGPGPAEPEDVRITGDRGTTAAIAAGRANAAEAFITGRVVVTGDRMRLLDARALLQAYDDAVADVARHTRFADA